MQNERTKADQYANNRRTIFIALAVIFLMAVVFVVVLFISNIPKTATIKVLVAPSTSTLTIGGKKYRTKGDIRIEPGEYEVKIQKDGFISYEGKISVAKGETAKLYECLKAEEGNDFYTKNTREYELCYTAQETTAEVEQRKLYDSDKIYTILPFHSYEKGFNIDANKAEDGDEKITIKITLLSCLEKRREGLKKNALEWLRENGVNPDDYNIIYAGGCDSSDQKAD